MENAIKALLIASGVLMAILIISLGMYIYSISSNTEQADSALSSLETQARDDKFKMYEGIQSGGMVKKLLQEAILNNQVEDIWKDDSIMNRCVCIRTNVREILDEFSGEGAMVSGLDGSREYGVKYPSNIKRISDCIEKSKKYKVYFSYNKYGYIWEIHIDDL